MNARPLAALAVLLVLAGCGNAAGEAASFAGRSTPLQNAYDKCVNEDGGDTLTLGDEGDSMFIDSGAEAEADIDGLVCVAIELGTPERIIGAMDSTNSLMGRQSEEADGLTYEWSYHPDNGLNVIISDQ